MSYATETRKGNPASLGAAVLVNGSIILAVALSPIIATEIKTDGGLTAIFVPIDKPPPEFNPPTDATNTKPLDPVFTPDPQITTIDTSNEINTTNQPADDQAVFDGMGGDDVAPQFIEPIDPPKPIFKAAVRDPRFMRAFQPDYPTGLLQKEIEGRATVRVLVGTDGRVRQVSILSASHPDFGKATERQALREWRFKPATRGGMPVEDWQTLTVSFNING